MASRPGWLAWERRGLCKGNFHPDFSLRRNMHGRMRVRDDFNWLLDFGLDVLSYGGNEERRALLVGGTADTMRWLRSQAPNARLTIVGHSLGSVIASHAASSVLVSEPILDRITLVTVGSPLVVSR